MNKRAIIENPDFTQKRRKGEIWCPYCSKWRKFKLGVYGYYKCVGCGVSTMEFSVRMANYLWDSLKPKDANLTKKKAHLEGKEYGGQ